jgi:Methyltransferase domain
VGETNLSMEKYSVLEGFHRQDIVRLLSGDENFGVELGIAEGIYSGRMVESGRFETYIGIDMYADGHDVGQYKRALAHVGLNIPGYKLLRMKFDEALDLFDDESLDFVYVDGYAHTGEEGGATIFQWYRKLKVGGLIAGDDYHRDWPLVIEAVDEFVMQTGGKLMVTELVEDTNFNQYPSWAMKKENDEIFQPDQSARKKFRDIQRRRARSYHLHEFLVNALPETFVRLVKKMRSTFW